MEEPVNEEYAAFKEKVKRTVFIDNLSPSATVSVLKAAFNQFGKVTNVHIYPDHIEPENPARAALVEMETASQAEAIMDEVRSCPFMICGMPRPVRAFAAQMEMFEDCPRKPGRKIMCKWVDSTDPEFPMAKKMKALALKHAAEAKLLMEKQLEKEQELAKKQQMTLKGNYKKYELLEGVTRNGPSGSANQLARRFGLKDGDHKKFH